MINVVVEMGRLTADPELRKTSGAEPKSVCTFTLAVNENEKVSFFDVIAWEKNAEALAKYMHKGDKIVVLGKLGTHSWVNKDGNLRRKIEIVAKRIVFAESNPKLDQTDKNKLNPENYSMDEWKLIADQMNRDITENPPDDDLPF